MEIARLSPRHRMQIRAGDNSQGPTDRPIVHPVHPVAAAAEKKTEVRRRDAPTCAIAPLRPRSRSVSSFRGNLLFSPSSSLCVPSPRGPAGRPARSRAFR